jgi:hypothetical protein
MALPVNALIIDVPSPLGLRPDGAESAPVGNLGVGVTLNRQRHHPPLALGERRPSRSWSRCHTVTATHASGDPGGYRAATADRNAA